MTVDDDLALSQNQIKMQELLWENDLFQKFKILNSQLLLALEDKKIGFPDSTKGTFAEDILRWMIDESVAFLATLEGGAFYGCFHHTRALIELYASVVYCFSDTGLNKKMLKRYNLFPKAFFFQKLQKGSSFWNLSQDEIDRLKKTHSELTEEEHKLFNSKKPIKSWRGGLSIQDLINELSPIHNDNYEKACHYTHLSPLIKRRSIRTWGLPNYWKEMLLLTVKYSFDICLLLTSKGSVDTTGKEILDEQWDRIAPTLTKECQQQAPKETATHTPENQVQTNY